MRKLVLFALFVVVVLAASSSVAADVSSYSCGLKVVYIGDLEDDVLMKCGQPTYKEGFSWVYARGSSDSRVIIHWGPGGRFRHRVSRIEITEK